MAESLPDDSWASSSAVRKSMRSNRRRDTGPEMAVRRLVHAAGLRYRVDYAPLPEMKRRKADLVFTRAKVAVFIDGCFWHGCPEHRQVPKTNAKYWAEKIEGNRTRDAEFDAALSHATWTVLRFWEHSPARNVAQEIVGRCQKPRTEPSV